MVFRTLLRNRGAWARKIDGIFRDRDGRGRYDNDLSGASDNEHLNRWGTGLKVQDRKEVDYHGNKIHLERSIASG